MYITSFYSFKGGVGRTMALVNAAVELARSGRRVLMVDFDLEAPGLDTFGDLGFTRQVPGIVDFVGEYVDTGRAPDAAAFLDESTTIGREGGKLWLMPAGTPQEGYAENFQQIDWNELYEERDGFLLFEDLKEQWREVIQPQYVFVDSRTGHTDIGGICTRHLPDAVAILFFPNEQNLRGLAKVVSDIRVESVSHRRKEIKIHFVLSNVPDLDDEDSILETKIDSFRTELGFQGDPMVVHRYDSLSLLNQVIFTQDRPRSRLAEEYRNIVEEIVRNNLDDREGALHYIRRAGRSSRLRRPEQDSAREMDVKLDQIERSHFDDGEVLFNLGVLRQEEQQLERAISLFDRSIEAGYDESNIFVRKARAWSIGGDKEAASREALVALERGGLRLREVRQAIRLIQFDDATKAAMSVAVAQLDVDEKIILAKEALYRRAIAGAYIAKDILEPIVEDTDVSSEFHIDARSSLALVYISLRKLDKAIELFVDDRVELYDMNLQDSFNFGMALWGAKGTLDKRPFQRVVEILDSEEDFEQRDDANFLQCMAVTHWVLTRFEEANEFAGRAKSTVDSYGPEFSCWRYRYVSPEEFKSDVDEIALLISGEASPMPHFMTDSPARLL